MKYKITKKEVKQNYKILGVGYCNMQYLLSYQKPIAYTAGAYGWNEDIYNIEGITISTGYNYTDSKNIKKDYELIKKYEDKARAIKLNYNLTYEQRKIKVNNLLYKLLKVMDN